MSTNKANTIQPLSDSASVVIRTNAQDSLTVDSSGNLTVRNEAVIDGINIGLGGGGVSTNLRVGTSAFGGGANSGANNTAIGYTSLRDHSIGTNNVGVGNASLLLLTTGSNNTGIGYGAGDTITVNSQNTCIGSGADVSSISISNSIAIGHNASAATNKSVYLGNASTNSLYMGNGSVVAPVYLPRAWVNFNGISAAYETVSASYLGPGTYTVRVTQPNHGHQVGHKIWVIGAGAWTGAENGDSHITSVIDQNTFEYWTAQAGNVAASGTVQLRKCTKRGNGNVHSVYQANPATFNPNLSGFGGYYFINLITPLPDANYCILGMSSLAGYTDANCANTTVERCSNNTFFGRTNNSAAIVVVNNNDDNSYNSFSTNVIFIR